MIAYKMQLDVQEHPQKTDSGAERYRIVDQLPQGRYYFIEKVALMREGFVPIISRFAVAYDMNKNGEFTGKIYLQKHGEFHWKEVDMSSSLIDKQWGGIENLMRWGWGRYYEFEEEKNWRDTFDIKGKKSLSPADIKNTVQTAVWVIDNEDITKHDPFFGKHGMFWRIEDQPKTITIKEEKKQIGTVTQPSPYMNPEVKKLSEITVEGSRSKTLELSRPQAIEIRYFIEEFAPLVFFLGMGTEKTLAQKITEKEERNNLGFPVWVTYRSELNRLDLQFDDMPAELKESLREKFGFDLSGCKVMILFNKTDNLNERMPIGIRFDVSGYKKDGREVQPADIAYVLGKPFSILFEGK